MRTQLFVPASGFAAAFLTVVIAASADDWYRWRGPNLNGVSNESEWLHDWPEQGPKVLWRGCVGTGFSSVVVSENRLYTVGNEENTDTVYCLHAETGKQIWSHSYECPLGDHFFAGGPTATPTVDGGFVYTLSRQGDLFCFHAETGDVRWSKSVAEQSGVRVPGWGFAGSPLVHQKLILLNVGEAGTAVDKSTGRIVWTSADKDAGYATPLPVHRDGRWMALIASSKFFIAVDVESGQELWRHRWLTRNGCNAADPIVQHDHLFISSGYNRGSALLKLTSVEPEVVWTSKEMQNQFSSSTLLDGYLYGVDGDTTSEQRLKCMNFKTGEVQWSWEGIGSGSFMAADSKLIILSEQGELIIARATPSAFEPLGRATVLDGTCWTVPVLCSGRIYCRNAVGDVVCLDVRT